MKNATHPALFQLPTVPAETHKFDRARAFFTQQFHHYGGLRGRYLLRYFKLCEPWKTSTHRQITTADRDFYRRDAPIPCSKARLSPPKMVGKRAFQRQIRRPDRPQRTEKQRCFGTSVLPDFCAILSAESRTDHRTRLWDRSSGQFSVSGSTPCG